MGTTSAWPTWMAATARFSSPTRRALLVWVSPYIAPTWGLPSPPPAPPSPPDDVNPFDTAAPSFPGLAIDYPESKLYWISSGNGTINRCNLDGSDLEVIVAVKSQLSKATALAIMGESCGMGCRVLAFLLACCCSLRVGTAPSLHAVALKLCGAVALLRGEEGMGKAAACS